MNQNNRNRLSLGLMISSLIILLIFQGTWLFNEYEKTKARLQHDADRLFMNSVRSIEDSIFNEVLIRPFVLQLNDIGPKDTLKNRFPGLISNRIKATKSKFPDSPSTKITISSSFSHSDEKFPEGTKSHVRILESSKKTIKASPDSSFRFFWRSKGNADGEKTDHVHKESGNLSFIIALSDTGAAGDSVFARLTKNPPPIREILERNFSKEMKDSDIPLDYFIFNSTEADSILPGLVSNSYFDMPSQQNYFVQFPRYKGYVIQNIIPQILFSIFLFFCISMAYFIIYRSLQKQRKLNQLKNDFISNITHELKTPITTVGVAIEAMRNFHALQNPERTREYLDISRKELNRLALLVDKVLKMSMFEHTEPQLKIEFIDINELLQQILNSMKLQFEKLGAELVFTPLIGDFQVRGDQTHLTSVVYNLIDNALKYRSEDPVIEIVLRDTGDQIQLAVSDNGPGIPMEYQDKIFEKFFRVPSGNQHNTKGYGLGLAYVAGVIDKHNGTIQVKSQPGAGTRFTIDLPKAHG